MSQHHEFNGKAEKPELNIQKAPKSRTVLAIMAGVLAGAGALMGVQCAKNQEKPAAIRAREVSPEERAQSEIQDARKLLTETYPNNIMRMQNDKISRELQRELDTNPADRKNLVRVLQMAKQRLIERIEDLKNYLTNEKQANDEQLAVNQFVRQDTFEIETAIRRIDASLRNFAVLEKQK